VNIKIQALLDERVAWQNDFDIRRKKVECEKEKLT